MMNKTYIGAFALHVKGNINQYYNVVSFELTKAVGAYATCQITVADCTTSVEAIKSSFPKVGSISQLFDKTIASQAQSALADCSLIQYKQQGTKTWFQGKLCTITPALQTSQGVSAGLQCYCAGKACQLQYCPIGDYVYTPKAMADDVSFMQKVGVFEPNSLKDALFAASNKMSTAQVINGTKINMDNNILQMMDKSLSKLMQFQKFKDSKLNELQTPVKLSQYFTCAVYPSKILKGQCYAKMHPYMQKLVQDFMNGYENATILDAVAQTLQGSSRLLTFVPPAMGQPDKLKIWPSFIQKLNKEITLSSQDMLGCSITSNPLSHLRTPTYIYIRARMAAAYQTGDKEYSRITGRYALQGAKEPYRLKLLDVPSWILNTVIQGEEQENNKKSQNGQTTQLVNKDAQAGTGKKEQKSPIMTAKSIKALLDAYAKTIYFHTYMMDKQAFINLAVTDKTLSLDKYIGQSLAFQMPVDASQLGTQGKPMKFYGRLQNITYAFKAATAPSHKSVLQLSCMFHGVTPQASPAKSLFTDDNKTFIYDIRGK